MSNISLLECENLILKIKNARWYTPVTVTSQKASPRPELSKLVKSGLNRTEQNPQRVGRVAQ